MVFALVRPSVPNATCCRPQVADITPELPPLPTGGRVCTDVKEGDDVSATPVFTQVGSSTQTPARQLCSGQQGRFTGEINLHNAEKIRPVFVDGLPWDTCINCVTICWDLILTSNQEIPGDVPECRLCPHFSVEYRVYPEGRVCRLVSRQRSRMYSMPLGIDCTRECRVRPPA